MFWPCQRNDLPLASSDIVRLASESALGPFQAKDFVVAKRNQQQQVFVVQILFIANVPFNIFFFRM